MIVLYCMLIKTITETVMLIKKSLFVLQTYQRCQLLNNQSDPPKKCLLHYLF